MTRTAVGAPEDGDFLVFETTEHVASRDVELVRNELAETFGWPIKQVVVLQNLRMTVLRKETT